MKKRILITVKTYPNMSGRYIEVACTAGLDEDGNWIRLYPIPFRLLEKQSQYHKYQWIKVDIKKNEKDKRPESYRLVGSDKICLLNGIGTDNNWEERKNLVLKGKKTNVYEDLTQLINLAHENKVSLATFRPSEIIGFVAEDVDTGYPRKRKQQEALNALNQGNLFEGYNRDDFMFMPRLPKKFSYKFSDNNGRKSTLMIEDWEIGQLYLNCLKNGNEEEAVRKVREKYFDDFVRTKDLYLFLGTTYQWHLRKSHNPFVIVGTFHPPHTKQEQLPLEQ